MKVALILKSPEMNFAVEEENVIYADAAYKFSAAIGKKNVLGVVGDFDSLGKAPTDEKVVSLEVEKNFTDGERAVRYAKEVGADEIVIYGAYGGKIEHILGNLALLKIAESIGLKAVIKDGTTIMQLISGKVTLNAKKGGTLSLIPYGGDCRFKSSEGLYYPLDGLTLTPCDTRGISNKITEQKVRIESKKGEALVIYEIKAKEN